MKGTKILVVMTVAVLLSMNATAFAGEWVNTEGNHYEGRSVTVAAVQISGGSGIASVIFEDTLNGGNQRFHFLDLNPQAAKQMYATLLVAKAIGAMVTVSVQLNYNDALHRIYDVEFGMQQ